MNKATENFSPYDDFSVLADETSNLLFQDVDMSQFSRTQTQKGQGDSPTCNLVADENTKVIRTQAPLDQGDNPTCNTTADDKTPRAEKKSPEKDADNLPAEKPKDAKDSEPETTLKESDKTAAKDFKTSVEKFEKAIKQADLTTPDFEKNVARLDHTVMMLERDRERKANFGGLRDGQREDPKALTDVQKAELHQSYETDSNKLASPVTTRLNYAKFLADAGRFEDAAKIGLEAQKLADKFSVSAKITEHITATPLDIEMRLRMTRPMSWGLSNPLENKGPSGNSLSKSVVETSEFLQKMYIGPEVDWQKPSLDKLAESKTFDPIKAYETMKKMSEFQVKNPTALLSGGEQGGNTWRALTTIFADPDKFRLSERVGSDGKPYTTEKINKIAQDLGVYKSKAGRSEFDEILRDTINPFMYDPRYSPLRKDNPQPKK